MFLFLSFSLSGGITIEEIFRNFKMEGTEFERKLLTLFNDSGQGFVYPVSVAVNFSYFSFLGFSFSDHSKVLNFVQFVCILWAFLSSPEDDLGSIIYTMCSANGTKANISCKQP
jgi:hypothetical protein